MEYSKIFENNFKLHVRPICVLGQLAYDNRADILLKDPHKRKRYSVINGYIDFAINFGNSSEIEVIVNGDNSKNTKELFEKVKFFFKEPEKYLSKNEIIPLD